ncbi:hypothetical protein EV702DRAFT_1177652 [Suillus placidus]|uniref:DUF6570 domain-containing protein n=1 Tax=Suillus placidus TaxID=48579 RepID=A0A9P7A360_9AGAM|nr:hypothetical protein EV702DRAFT_1177652 [Suillus placidus]
MLSCFTFGHDLLDGLILDAAGVIVQDNKPITVRICSECHSSLSNGKVPPLALANGLFRGYLPNQFLCAIYCITAHVTRLFQSSDPSQPMVSHGNTCAHDMNVMSTATVLPRTPADINGFISVVFIGPDKFDPKCMDSLFRVRKGKIWAFLTWLKGHNHLYADLPLDASNMDLYPEDLEHRLLTPSG